MKNNRVFTATFEEESGERAARKLRRVFSSIRHEFGAEWNEKGVWPKDPADYMPFEIERQSAEEVVVITPTSGRRVTITRTPSGVQVEVAFGERGSLEAAAELARGIDPEQAHNLDSIRFAMKRIEERNQAVRDRLEEEKKKGDEEKEECVMYLPKQ